MTGSYSRRRLPRVRLYTDICEWADWRRPRPCHVRRVVYRSALTGMPVEVLVPTLRGRLAMWLRAWREAG